MIERIRNVWDASVTADLSHTTSLQLLLILTNLKPHIKLSELRVEMRYGLLGQRCEMAHARQADHQTSNWNRIEAPVLGPGVKSVTS